VFHSFVDDEIVFHHFDVSFSVSYTIKNLILLRFGSVMVCFSFSSVSHFFNNSEGCVVLGVTLSLRFERDAAGEKPKVFPCPLSGLSSSLE